MGWVGRVAAGAGLAADERGPRGAWEMAEQGGPPSLSRVAGRGEYNTSDSSWPLFSTLAKHSGSLGWNRHQCLFHAQHEEARVGSRCEGSLWAGLGPWVSREPGWPEGATTSLKWFELKPT